MSRSKRDRAGKRINGEITGRNTTKIVDGRMIIMAGGEEVGSAARKKDAKRTVVRQRRLDDKRIIRNSDSD